MQSKLEKIKYKLLERMKKYSDNEIKLETLPIEKIRAFENEHQIKLPEEIVDFYTKVSNGAVLYPNEDYCNLEPFEKWCFSPDLINKDFNIENDVTYDDYCEIKNKDQDYSFENLGNITLIDLGCDMSYRIIVKGKHYGEIIAKLEMWLEITNKTFLDWLEDCIDGTTEYMI